MYFFLPERISVCYVQALCSRRLEESITSPGTGVRDAWELEYVWWGLWKISQHSFIFLFFVSSVIAFSYVIAYNP